MTAPRPELIPLPAGLRRDLATAGGRIAWYATSAENRDGESPLLLIHSVNAAASAHEVRPLFEHFGTRRPTYAIDLPGFGLSERISTLYRPRRMTDAVLAVVNEIRDLHGGAAVDALAVSLSSEFLVRAAMEQPQAWRSVALVSPTGFGRGAPFRGPSGSDRGMAGVWRVFSIPFIGAPLFRLLTSRASIRFFLQKTWGSKDIDEQMWLDAWRTAHAPGARHAPLSFLSGYLFSADISTVYESLALPVWVAHGVRGDFTDYRGMDEIADRPNWKIEIFDTGALPYFEATGRFLMAYERFLHLD